MPQMPNFHAYSGLIISVMNFIVFPQFADESTFLWLITEDSWGIYFLNSFWGKRGSFDTVCVCVCVCVCLCLCLCVCVITQSGLTLSDPMDCSPPGSSVLEFSRQEYWNWLPFPSPGDLSNPGIEPGSPALQADSLLTEPPGKPKTCCTRWHNLLGV